MNEELRATGAHIDQFYYCPHHPEGTVADYQRQCACRKPEPGMLRNAMADWDIELERSFLVGDKPSDIEAGQAVGVRSYLFTDDDLETLIKNGCGYAQGR
jgi:D-glycero-D-manno-heptose 1,7-bisphosphate phosphatase